MRVVHGDAFVEIPKLPGTFDLVFLDAWKPDYKTFFDMVYPRMDAGGVFLAHNVINKSSEMKPFLDTIQNPPGLFTSIVSPSVPRECRSPHKLQSSEARSHLIGVPLDLGAGRRGVDMGPSAFRIAGTRRSDRRARIAVAIDKGDLPAPIPETQRPADKKKKYIRDIAKVCQKLYDRRARSRSTKARCRSCSAAITASPPDRWRPAPTGCGARRRSRSA